MRGILIGMFLLIALVGLAPSAQAAQCSVAGAAGKYGLTLTGVLITPSGALPAAPVGHAKVDFSGHVTGSEARSVGGGYADETLSGTMAVNPDCTGSMTVSFYENGQEDVRPQHRLREQPARTHMVQKSLTLPNGAALPVVITVEAKKTFTEDGTDLAAPEQSP